VSAYLESEMRTILIADDEPHVRRVVAGKLRAAGFEVVTVADGLEALDHVTATRPDLVITDHLMPGLTGAELCIRIRELPGCRALPIILLTAHGHAVTAAAATLVLAKPFSPRQLLATVENLLAPAAAA